MDTNDGKDKNYPLSTIYDENDNTKYSIEPAKQSPSVGAQIETSQFSFIATVPIVAKTNPFF